MDSRSACIQDVLKVKVTWYAHFLEFLEWATPSLAVFLVSEYGDAEVRFLVRWVEEKEIGFKFWTAVADSSLWLNSQRVGWCCCWADEQRSLRSLYRNSQRTSVASWWTQFSATSPWPADQATDERVLWTTLEATCCTQTSINTRTPTRRDTSQNPRCAGRGL